VSRTIQPTSQTEAEPLVWPAFSPSPRYRSFIERLRLARLERGLSIADMTDEVGLSFKLAYEFENIVTPLPFDYLEVWCETVGIPFADYLAIYRADQREWDERQDQLEIAPDQQQHSAPCITVTAADEIEATETAPTSVNRRFGVLNLLRAAFDRIASFFHSRFCTPQ
jgi:transcriptional regulator with XRE-family HTH domain